MEDEPALGMLLSDRLLSEGYEPEVRTDGPSGTEAAISGGFDLILLDIMLPGFDGFEVCRRLRSSGCKTPVLMLTARGEVRDRVAGLKTGADDYLPKPFDSAELLARMEALLRRSGAARHPDEFGSVRVDRVRRVVMRADVPVELSYKEYQMLCYLLDRADVPVSRQELLHKVWGYERTPNTRTVDVHMAQLRQKLEDNPKEPQYLVTEHGVGYKFNTGSK